MFSWYIFLSLKAVKINWQQTYDKEKSKIWEKSIVSNNFNLEVFSNITKQTNLFTKMTRFYWFLFNIKK